MDRPNYALSPGIKERYTVLLDVGRILTATLKPDELYRAIYEQTSRVLETTGFYISLYDLETDLATVVFYADRGQVGRVEESYRGSQSIAIREGRPVLTRLENPDEAILLLGPNQDQVTRASISAPLMRDGKVLGVISAQSYQADSYDQDDLELLTALADLAAVALGNVQYVAELERRQREAERLEEIGRALAASLELSQVLERVVAAAIDLIDADSVHVWLLQDDGISAVAAAGGGQQIYPVGATLTVAGDLRTKLVERRETIVIEDVATNSDLPADMRNTVPNSSSMAVPLVADDRVIGALSVGHREHHHYLPSEIWLLERVGNQASIALENARLHEEIRALSLTDPLTGLPNRRHMEMFLSKEFAAAQRGRPLTVVLFDLDRFKEYNDAVGHQAGDQALRTFSRILEGSTRAMNLGARYGGDEFISILADSTYQGGVILATRIAEAVAGHPGLEGIGVSAGVASYTSDMVCADDLIRAADRDLYKRKADRSA